MGVVGRGEAAGAAPRWYVAYTRPRGEFVAERHLVAQGFSAFLPAHSQTTRHARQFRTARAAFFPRYLFVSLDLDRDRWRSVSSTRGVSHLIMEGDGPKPVPSGIVEGLRAITDSTGLLSFASELAVGQSVRLLSGPLAGRLGTLVRLTSAERVEVLLELMESQVMLSVAKNILAPAA